MPSPVYLPNPEIELGVSFTNWAIRECKYVNSCKYNVNTMQIVASIWQIQVSLFETFWIFFWVIFDPAVVQFALVEGYFH